MKATAYNTLGTKDCRVVATFDVETDDTREALDLAVYRSLLWNKTETRDNMRVNFVMASGHVRTV